VARFLEAGQAEQRRHQAVLGFGHVNRPGNYEIPLGTPFSTLLEMCGGMRGGRKLKAVIPGGSSAPVMPGDVMMDCTMDYDGISKAGSMLGSGAVIVMDETVCMVKALERLSFFYYEESCGQCTPCREGTAWMYKVVHRIENGLGKPGDLDLLNSVWATSWAAPSARSAMPQPCRCRASSSIFGKRIRVPHRTQDLSRAQGCSVGGQRFPQGSGLGNFRTIAKRTGYKVATC
jgi:NADH:ubiquinone oxidoreductase subunit F (NADH-binding)